MFLLRKASHAWYYLGGGEERCLIHHFLYRLIRQLRKQQSIQSTTENTKHAKTVGAFHLPGQILDWGKVGKQDLYVSELLGPSEADDVDTVLMSCERTKSPARFYSAI